MITGEAGNAAVENVLMLIVSLICSLYTVLAMGGGGGGSGSSLCGVRAGMKMGPLRSSVI